MSEEVRSSSLEKAEAIRAEFKDLLARTKDHPRAEDIKALSDLLNGNKSLELWRDVLSAAQYAERAVIENSPGVHGVKECWRLRLASLRNELGYAGAPILEQLLIQDAALSWLKLSIVELQYSHVMKQSITLTHGIFWEKR